MSSVLIHGAFDVLAWLAAGLALLWLTRGAKVAFPAVAGRRLALSRGAPVRRRHRRLLFGTANLWLSQQCRHRPLDRGRHRGRHRGGRALQAQRRHHAPAPARASRCRSRSASRSAASAAISPGLDDFTYGTPTDAALGPRFRRRHRAPSGAALRERRDGGVRGRSTSLRVRPRRPLRDRQRLLSRRRLLRRCSASSGSSSSPMAPLIGPFTLFHLLSARDLRLRRRHDRDRAHSEDRR